MDYEPQNVLIRDIPGIAVIEQVGDQVDVNGVPARIVTAVDVISNPGHYYRQVVPSLVARMERGEIAAVVQADRSHGPAFAPKGGMSTYYLPITAEQFALGAAERARYQAWLAGVVADKADRVAAERAYDLINNEGGDGYNPHRAGDERSYARDVSYERHFPAGA